MRGIPRDLPQNETNLDRAGQAELINTLRTMKGTRRNANWGSGLHQNSDRYECPIPASIDRFESANRFERIYLCCLFASVHTTLSVFGNRCSSFCCTALLRSNEGSTFRIYLGGQDFNQRLTLCFYSMVKMRGLHPLQPQIIQNILLLGLLLSCPSLINFD